MRTPFRSGDIRKIVHQIAKTWQAVTLPCDSFSDSFDRKHSTKGGIFLYLTARGQSSKIYVEPLPLPQVIQCTSNLRSKPHLKIAYPTHHSHTVCCARKNSVPELKNATTRCAGGALWILQHFNVCNLLRLPSFRNTTVEQCYADQEYMTMPWS